MFNTGCYGIDTVSGKTYDIIRTEKDLEQLMILLRGNILSKEKTIEELRAELKHREEEVYRDEEVARLQEQVDQYWEQLRYGFGITKAESEKIYQWQKNHDATEHKNPTGYHGTSGGGYTYKFYPTAIGTFWNCTCDICARRATDAAYTDGKYNPDAYKKYMEEHNGKIEFDDV